MINKSTKILTQTRFSLLSRPTTKPDRKVRTPQPRPGNQPVLKKTRIRQRSNTRYQPSLDPPPAYPFSLDPHCQKADTAHATSRTLIRPGTISQYSDAVAAIQALELIFSTSEAFRSQSGWLIAFRIPSPPFVAVRRRRVGRFLGESI